jgi:hypothetical protein
MPNISFYIPEKRKRCAQSHTWVLEIARKVLSDIETYAHVIQSRTSPELTRLDSANQPITKIAIGLAPEPFGLAQIYTRMPYTNPEHLRQGLQIAVDHGWLTIIRSGVYQASRQSQELYSRLSQKMTRVYSDLCSLPEEQLQWITTHLEDIVNSVAHSTVVEYKPAFDLDIRLALAPQNTLAQICNLLSHLLAYRDDAYVAAWMAQEVNSYVWETFSYIYKGLAHDAAQMVKKLGSKRHYGLEAYDIAISELVKREWITTAGRGYEPTPAGMEVVAEVARALSFNFSEPWIVWDENLLKELREKLESLSKTIKPYESKTFYGHAEKTKGNTWGTVLWAQDKTR